MRTVIDIDDEALDAARNALGTTTKVDTVNEALREVGRRAAAREALAWFRNDPLPDLRDDEVMGAAWS